MARHLANVAEDVGLAAAGLVRSAMGRAEVAGRKSTPTDVVTHTDIASEQLIRRELLLRCPGSSIVGEELPDEIGTNRVEWIVDPIDGTVNFLYDLPVVSVSIAARLDEEIVAGAVVDVIRGDVFSAAIREGAAINGEAIKVAARGPMSQSLIGTGFAYQAEVRAEQSVIIARLLPVARDIRCMGSAALNLCWVACGRLDGYYERGTKLYDYAAAALIAQEAGAHVGLPSPTTGASVIGARPQLYDELHSLVTGSVSGDGSVVPQLK